MYPAGHFISSTLILGGLFAVVACSGESGDGTTPAAAGAAGMPGAVDPGPPAGGTPPATGMPSAGASTGGGAVGAAGAAVGNGGSNPGSAGNNPGSAGDDGMGMGGSAGANPELDAKCTPDFTLELDSPDAEVFSNAVQSNPEAYVQDIGRKVCQILYRQPAEVRDANHITLIIEDTDGVAWKAGDVGDISVGISTRHLRNVEGEGRDVGEEISGILFHEMTHMYQHDDKPEATFEYIANMYEGIADAVRIRAGFAPGGARPNDKGGSWYEKTYTSQGFFWLFVDTKYPDFLYQLNYSMLGRDEIAWTPDTIEEITGQSADELWQEYQGASCCEGSDRSCCQ